MTVFFPLNCLSEMFSPVVAGRVKSGAVRAMTGSMLMPMHPPKTVPGFMSALRAAQSPVMRGAQAAPRFRCRLLVDRLHGERPFQARLHHAPVQVVEERLDVL